jgi:hypothetical protein
MDKMLNAIIRLVAKHTNGEYSTANEYGERGYSKESDKPIIFANWNRIPAHIKSGLERRGFTLQYQDEWVTDNRGYAYRCTGDCYEWKPYYLAVEGEIIGGDKIEEDRKTQEWYIENFLLNDPENACIFRIDLSEHGFVKCNEDEYEIGFHPGQNDNPREILEKAQETWPDHDFVFGKLRAEQFQLSFNLYRRKR